MAKTRDQETTKAKTTTPPNPPLLLRITDAARALGVGRTTAYEMAASGAIPTVVIRGIRRIPREALEDFIRRRIHPAR